MNRRHLTFGCEGETLVGTIDRAESTTGLLIVSGGNELRCGPWASQAMIAAKIAAAGFPAMRFDRRGVGDSTGENTGFELSGPDIAAALRAFQAHVPTLKRVVAYGNCDAASALMLHAGTGCAALVLSNPWTIEPAAAPAPGPASAPATDPMPPSALRAHYLRRITSPRAWLRLLTGKVEVGKMAASLVESAMPDGPQSGLSQRMSEGLARFEGQVSILLAERDRTAQAFLANWDKGDQRIRRCPDASHSFAEAQARIWLQGQLLAALRAQG